MNLFLSSDLKQVLSNQNQVSSEYVFNGFDRNKKPFISPVGGALQYDLSRHVQYNLSPITAINSGQFTSGTPIVFNIQPGYCGEIELVTINFTARETGGSDPVTPVVVPYMFNRIEVGFNSSSTPVQTIYADELYSSYQQFNLEQIQNLLAFNQQNMTATAFAGESAIAASGSAYYSMPLMSVLNKLNPQTISGNVVISVWMQTNPVSTGDGTLSLIDMQLRILTRKNEESIDAKIMELYNTPCYIPFCQFTQATWTGTLAPGVLTELPLNGLNGMAGALVIMIRASKSVTSSAIRTFSSISGTDLFKYSGLINLVDSSKQPLLGSAGISGRDSRARSAAFHAPSVFSSIVPVYFIYFAENFINAVTNGINSGMIFFNNQQYIQLTPGSTFSSSTYTVDVYAYMFQCLQQKGGFITKSF